MRRLRSRVLLLLLIPIALHAQSAWFPFTLPWDDDSRTAVDASDLLVDYPGQDPSTVIDSRGYLRTRSDGHFYFERTGRRARFWGVNFVFNANFPPCPDEPLRPGEYPDVRAAEKVARRLAKLGVNVVRLHHMDFFASPSGIWDPRHYPDNTQHLDPGQLRRLDYLIYQLRKSGIYVNINLKVARHFGPGDGVADATLFSGPIRFFQGVSHYNARMIELQRDYARMLLTRRNPYTGMTYAEDPAVAFVEIANEDSLFGNLLSDGGLNYLPGVPDSLPESYSLELDAMWNGWLASRYPSRPDLESAWKGKEDGADTSNRMRNPGFESGMSEWIVHQLGQARATARVEAGAGPDGSAALRVDVVSDGTNWHVQAMQNGHAIEKGKTYEFTFRARAAVAGDVTVDVMKGAAPWQNYGLSKTFRVAPTWRQYRARFQANADDGATARPTFELGAQDNTIWLDDVQFRRSVPLGLETDESFDNGSVRRPVRSELGGYTEARIIDLFRFYSEVDESYFSGMRRFLKEDLAVKAMVTGTAPWWAYLGDTAIQSRLDFVDGHYYWDHPYWTGVPSWSPTGWRIRNSPWINQLEELSTLASQAVEGKPFTVSEFNHVFPNRYALEGPLLIALVANLQDWDAVYMFDYAGSAEAYDDAHATSFFSIAGNPVKSAQLPVASRIFLGRQSSAATRTVHVELNRDEPALGYARGLINASSLLESKGLDRRAFLQSRLRIRSFDRAQPAPIEHTMPPGTVTSSNGEVTWNRDNTQSSFLRVQGSGVQGAIGFLGAGRFDFGSWEFEIDPGSPEHMAVLLQSRDAVPLRESRRMLLTVWAEHENTGMGWNTDRTSVDDRWGRAPAIVRPARLELNLKLPAARELRLFPLDSRGDRSGELQGEAPGDSHRFVIDTGRDRTVWYEIEINEPATVVDFSLPSPGLFQLYTADPAGNLRVGWLELENVGSAQLQATTLLEYASRGVLTSMVRLPSSAQTVLARAPVIHSSLVDTAVAILNRQPVDIDVFLTLMDGSAVPRGNPVAESLRPGESRAFFVRERFPLGDFEGLLELRSGLPFHYITLRSITNSLGDFALTPYPQDSSAVGPLHFSHLVADPDYSSDILLWNSQTEDSSVRVEFRDAAGRPASPAGLPPSWDILLAPGHLHRIAIPRTGTAWHGYARLSLTAGTALPSASAVLTRWEDGSPVSEAGIPATPALYEEHLPVAERPDQKTALALLNTGSGASTVNLDLMSWEEPLPPPASIQLKIEGGEKRAFFLFEVFPALPAYFNGVVRIRTSGPPLATLSLLGAVNARGSFLMSALTGEPSSAPLSPGGVAVVPRFALGEGYRTILYLLSRPGGGAGTLGRIRFYDSSGSPLAVGHR